MNSFCPILLIFSLAFSPLFSADSDKTFFYIPKELMLPIINEKNEKNKSTLTAPLSLKNDTIIRTESYEETEQRLIREGKIVLYQEPPFSDQFKAFLIGIAHGAANEGFRFGLSKTAEIKIQLLPKETDSSSPTPGPSTTGYLGKGTDQSDKNSRNFYGYYGLTEVAGLYAHTALFSDKKVQAHKIRAVSDTSIAYYLGKYAGEIALNKGLQQWEYPDVKNRGFGINIDLHFFLSAASLINRALAEPKK